MPKFLASSAALLRCLKEVSTVVKRNPLLPAIANVLLTVEGTTLTVVGTDLENTVTVTLPIERASTGTEPWALCPPSKPLMEVLKNLPDQPIILESGPKEDQLTIKAGVQGITEHETDHGASYTFAYQQSSDFPKTPKTREAVTITVPGHLLRLALGYTAEIVSNDELRPAMMCVCVVAKPEGIDFLSTDGHRLCIYEVQASKEPGYAFASETVTNKTMLLPQVAVKALRTLVNNDDVVTITSGVERAEYIRFQIGSYGPVLTVRPVDERYPDVYAVLPTEYPGGVLTLARPAARTMLTRMLPFCASASNRIDLHFAGTRGQARAENDYDDISAREPLPGTFTPGAYDANTVKVIGFNARMLAHVLSLLPGPRVRLSFVSMSKGCQITADGHDGLKYLLMPVMITDYN